MDALHKPPLMVCVFAERRCAGFLVPRGRDGFEAFDDAGASLGLFSSARAAAAAVMMRGPA
jgi:hypothetical protein